MLNRLFQALKRPFLRAFCHLSSPLPRGMQAFEAWYKSITAAYSFPDDLSYKNACATMIMHLGSTIDRKPRVYFARAVKKSMSNQIAYQVIEEIRAEYKAREEAAKLQPSAEVTHTTTNGELLAAEEPVKEATN